MDCIFIFSLPYPLDFTICFISLFPHQNLRLDSDKFVICTIAVLHQELKEKDMIKDQRCNLRE